ncbi:MAG: hypothetical protein RL521_843 [Bacteroidota bacterium]|jgi:hypothetical protein
MICTRAVFVCLLVLSISENKLLAQFDFADSNWSIPIFGESSNFSNGIAIQDINFDGFDDIAVAENMMGIKIWTSTGTGFILQAYVPIQQDIKQISFVDANNDNVFELFACSYGGGIFLWQSQDLLNWSLIQNEFSDYWGYHYGASWSDYDKDGDLDVFICQYVDFLNAQGLPNLFFENQGNYNFIEKSVELGLNIVTNNSFQSTWFDFNHDGWMDLYVINDHFVPNLFYRNVNGEYFVESGQDVGADISMFCMSNSIADFDNDGEWNIFMTDDNDPVLLDLNENQFYVNVADSMGLDSLTNGWGALWVDADYDGDEDLHIAQGWINAPFQNLFYYNNGNSFSQSNTFDTIPFSSYVNAKGDFNNDGRWDLVIRNEFPSNIQIGIGVPDTASNWMKINLQGTVSNSMGIGATVHVFAGGIAQQFINHSGENYIAQNSSSTIVGLSDWAKLDSVVVIWPSSQRETWQGLTINQSYQLVEGITVMSDTIFINASACEGGMAEITLPQDWYFGAFGSASSMQLAVGIYELQVLNQWNWTRPCVIHITEILPELGEWNVNWDCSLEKYVSNWTGSIPMSYVGLNFPVDSLNPGIYPFEWLNLQGCWQLDSLVLDTVVVPQIELLFPDTICYGEIVPWSCSWNNGYVPTQLTNVPDSVAAGEYAIHYEDTLGCSYQFAFSIANWPELNASVAVVNEDQDSSASIEISGGVPPYLVYVDNTLISNLEWTTQYSGTFPIQVLDANGCEWNDTFTVDIQSTGFNQFNRPENISQRDWIQVFDVSGRLIFEGSTSWQEVLENSSIVTGLYFVVSSGRTFKVQKK